MNCVCNAIQFLLQKIKLVFRKEIIDFIPESKIINIIYNTNFLVNYL
jgi:hypothetical protein